MNTMKQCRGDSRRAWLCWAVVTGAAMLIVGGCSDEVRRYTHFGAWSNSTHDPAVFSGSPSRDTAALGASADVLSDRDWQVLEKIAPKPIWERLATVREMFCGTDATTQPSPSSGPAPEEIARKLDRDVPVTILPDGRVQMFYRLRHYGGVNVTSARDGGTDRRKVTVTPNNLASLVALVKQQLAGQGVVVALPNTNSLVITCAPEAKASVLGLLAGVDVAPRQVEVTAKAFEVRHDFDFQVGARTLLEHMSGSGSQGVASAFDTQGFLDAVAAGTDFQGGILRILQVFEGAGLKLDMTLQMMVDTGLVKMVAAPRMTVTAGKTGYMLAGQELPIQSARYVSDQVLTDKTTYKPVGVQLYITPQIIGPESIKLHVVTIASAVSGFQSTGDLAEAQGKGALLNPVIDSREAETFVTVPNESTLVIGGLRMVRTISRERKTPGLGDLTGLGWFFKSHRSQNHVSDLYFFVTPRLIKTGVALGT